MVEPQISVGFDIGGTRIKAVAVSPEGRILARRTERTVDDVTALVGKVGAIIEELGDTDAAIGISAPGIASRNSRSIAWMRGRMEAVEELDWQRHLRRNAWVLNDAHAAAMAEAWVGAAHGVSHAVVLTFGTEVGGGVIVDGRLLQGATGRAGQLGHTTLDMDGSPDIVGMPGSLEDCNGNHNLSERSGGQFRDANQLVAAAEAVDVKAAQYWQRSVRGLAVAIASFINAFDPEIVVAGGGIAESGWPLFDLLREYWIKWNGDRPARG